MATAAQTNERLAALLEAGTSPWLDQIKRSLIQQGELERLIREDSLRGVTSNPAIFEKAILGSDEYDDEIERLAGEGLDATAIYLTLAIQDVQAGCDVMRPVWEEAGGADGFVSLEVEPGVAFDTDATLRQAHELWERVDRPNVLIKIPATDEGMPAIEQAICDGINVNVTLLFSVEAYEKVTERYIRGMERRHEEGKSLDVHSVASFFVSRVDSEVDKRLGELGREDLKGRAALANARSAYQSYERIFEGDRFAALRDAGAPVQRPLWASTGVKNPDYPETMYVDWLVAPNTVNTMPMATLNAVAEKGDIQPGSAETDPSDDLNALAEAGIDMKDVTDFLLKDGVEKFVVPFDKLLAGVESVKEAIVTGRPPTIDSTLPDELEQPIAKRAELAVKDNVARRIWRKDETLWGGPGPEIGNRLGWLTISEPMLEHGPELMEWARGIKDEGYTDAALLGMGGSSLGPEVIRRSYGDAGGLTLHVLDSTDPGAILELEGRLALDKTIFVVSSKSGGTVETLSHMKHFYEQTGRAGEQFVAVTDPGSGLIDEAGERGFRRVFQNDPNIGGRYSVLSYFGLVPAALAGVDVVALLESSREAEENCNSYDSTRSNSGLWLGLTEGELALEGRDKLTFVVDEPISSFGLWVEQLIAESTGKHGKGILPVADEPLGEPEAYGDDRVMAHLANAESPDEDNAAKVDALAKAGHAVVRLSSRGKPEDLGRIFFFAEFATAVAGWALEINPFDQPNVQEAKDKTKQVLEADTPPRVSEAGDEELRTLLGQAAPPHYVAIMGYVQPSEAFDEAVLELRAAIRDATKATTTFGYGPRFLHSTGQLHKGGPATGLFLQLIHDGDDDVEIPDADFTFGELKNAQATGDLQTLRDHGLPAEQVRLQGDPVRALRELTERIEGLLG